MTIHHPPRLATWILTRLGSSAIDDPLIGDLFEAYQTRRSPLWYWRQIGTAIIVAGCRDGRQHPPLAIGAMLTGLFVAITPAWLAVNISASAMSNAAVPSWIQGLAVWLIMFGSVLLSGWMVARLFGAHRSAAVLALTMAVVIAHASLFLYVTDISTLTLGGVLLMDALAAVGGGSLSGVPGGRPS